MSPRGGARPGSGRKPLPPEQRRVLVSARILPTTHEYIAIRRLPGESLGKCLDRLLSQH